MSDLRRALRELRKTSNFELPAVMDVRSLPRRDEAVDRATAVGGATALSSLGILGLSTLHPRLRHLEGLGHGLLRYGVPVSILSSLGTSAAQSKGWLP